MKRLLLPLCLLAAHPHGLPGTPPPPEVVSGYRDRLHEVLTWRSALVDPANDRPGGLAEIAARLALREDAAWCSERTIEMMRQPSGDMFWMFPCATVAYLGRDQLSPEARAAIREAWRLYMPMRGDTENHWIMYYVSLYLMAQLYPEEPGETWFTGKSSDENFREARDYILSWIDLTTTRGQGEYDCTHYIGEYVIPMIMLATWTEDPAMRQRGAMMLDYLLADFAADSLDGLYIGAHARTDDRGVLEPWNNLSSYFAWTFWDNVPPPPSYGGWGLYYAANAWVSGYLQPEVIRRIATERAGPYLHREVKRTRHRWRNSEIRNLPVYKQSYVTRDYAVGSSQGGLLQPIQQHTWDVTWAVDDPRGVHNTLFALNPHWSAEELQMYFTEMPDSMPEAVTRQGKPTYMSPETFLGGSPHEQVHQVRDALVALYFPPDGANHEHMNAFFSKDLARLEEDPSGWIFAQGGRAYLAAYPLSSYEWVPLENGGRRLHSPARANGFLLQVAAEAEFADWEAFKAAILALPLETATDPKPAVRFTSLRGDTLDLAFGEIPVVNGRREDFARWALFEGPYLNAPMHSRRLVLTHGELRRTLDFNTVTVTDEVRARP
jgi:hypothetical protein